MNYRAFTNDSLTMMYAGIRGALDADDALKELGEETRFHVRETPDWRKHAADLEAEMLGKCFSRLSTGQGDKARCPLRNELAAFAAHEHDKMKGRQLGEALLL